MVQAQRVKLREQEAIIECLKRKLVDGFEVSMGELSDWIEDALNRPKLVGRPQPEVLQKELGSLKKKNLKLKRALDKAKAELKQASARVGGEAPAPAAAAATAPAYNTFFSPRRQRKAMQRDELLDQAEYLKAELAARDESLMGQREMVMRLTRENQALKNELLRGEEVADQVVRMQGQMDRLRREAVESSARNEALVVELRKAQARLAHVTRSRREMEARVNAETSSKEHSLSRYKDMAEQLELELDETRTALQSTEELAKMHEERAQQAERARLEDIDKHHEELKAMRKERDAARAAVRKNEDKLDEHEGTNQELERLRHRLSELEAELANRGSEAPKEAAPSSSGDEQAAMERRSLERKITILQNKLSTKDVEIRRLKSAHLDELRELAAGLASGAPGQSESKLAGALSKQAKRLEADNKRLDQELTYQKQLNDHLSSALVAVQNWSVEMQGMLMSHGLRPPPRPAVAPT